MKLFLKILLTVLLTLIPLVIIVLLLCGRNGLAGVALFDGTCTLADWKAMLVEAAGSYEMITLYIVTLLVLPYSLYLVWRKPTEKSSLDIRRLVICALLTAIGVVLGGLLSIPALTLGVYSVKIGFGVLPVILAGVLYGPLYGGMVGGMTDFLQAILMPKGAYVPWFTVVGVLFGLIPGLFFMKKQKPVFLRVLLAVACGQLIGSVLLNTLLLVQLYDMDWRVLLVPRLINQGIMIPLYALLIHYIMKLLERAKVIEPR